ncbi:MAG: GCN5-related N-acetyltransferase [Gemmatimonadetes bacterium]|nr:GCN5-related N-acetyltransferase [Gemmatimonadota bacterium]
MPGQTVSKPAVDAVRRFSRFYTRIVGALDQGYLDSAYSLAEVRLLFELSNRDAPTAAVLMRDLDLDAGYMSRLVQRLVRRRLVKRTRSATDGRESHLTLTATGRAAFAELDARARADVAQLLAPLSADDQHTLVDAMARVRTLLGDEPDRVRVPAPMVVFRAPNPGDLGWIVQRHGELYAREYGWDNRFEGIVARIMADFVEHFDPQRERAWIAERDGVNAGCIMLVRHPERESVAKLRVLLVEPAARGLGIGNRLVDECIRFARSAGYHTITLWTYEVLASARKIYIGAGFKLVAEEKQHSFGRAMTSQTWELTL